MICTIPKDIYHLILGLCDINDIVALSLTCRRFLLLLSSSDQIWQLHCFKMYGIQSRLNLPTYQDLFTKMDKLLSQKVVTFEYINKNEDFAYDKLVKLEFPGHLNNAGNLEVLAQINWNYRKHNSYFGPSYSKVGFIGELFSTTNKDMFERGYVLTVQQRHLGQHEYIYISLENQTVIHVEKRSKDQMSFDFEPVTLQKVTEAGIS